MKPSRPIVLTSLALGLLTIAPNPAMGCEDDATTETKVIRLGEGDGSSIRVLTSDLLGDKAVRLLTGLCSEADGSPCIIRIGDKDHGPIAILIRGDGEGMPIALGHAGEWTAAHGQGVRANLAFAAPGSRVMTFEGDEKPLVKRRVVKKGADDNKTERRIVIKLDNGETIELDGDDVGTWREARGEDGKNIFVMKDGEGGEWSSEDSKDIVKKRIIKKGDGHDKQEHKVMVFVGEDGKVVELKSGNGGEWTVKTGHDDGKHIIKKRIMKGDGEHDVDVWFGEGDDGKHIIKKRIMKGDGEHDVDVWFGEGDDGKHIIKKRIMKGDGERDENVFFFPGDDDEDEKHVIKRRVEKKGDGKHGEIRIQIEMPELGDLSEKVIRRSFAAPGGDGQIEIIIEGLGDLDDMKGMLHGHLGQIMGDIDIDIDTEDLHEHLQHLKKSMGDHGQHAFDLKFDNEKLHEHLHHAMKGLGNHDGNSFTFEFDSDGMQEQLNKALKGVMKNKGAGNVEFEFKGLRDGNMPAAIEEQLRKHLGGLHNQHGTMEVQVEVDDEGVKPRIRFGGGQNSDAMKKRVMEMVRERVGDKADGQTFEIHVDVEEEDEDGQPHRERQVWVTGPDGASMTEVHGNKNQRKGDGDDSLLRRIDRLEDRIDRMTAQLERLMKRLDR